MPRNGSGTYSLPAGNPVVNGTIITDTWANDTLGDISTALTNSLAKNGETTPTANLPMGGFKLSGLGAGSANGDSLRFEQLSAAVQGQGMTAGTTGGTSTAYTLTPTPAIVVLATSQRFRVNFHTAAGATPTLAISGLTAKNLKYYDGAGTKQFITSQQVPTGFISDVEYDGTDMVVLNVRDSNAIGFLQSGSGSVVRSAQSKFIDSWISVKDKGAVGDGTTDDTAAIQAAHDSLPATGGTIFFPNAFYNLNTTAVYVSITKPNVTLLGDAGAWVVSPLSSDPEVKTGTSILNGFLVTGNNCVVSVNMRGPLVSWTPQAATDCLYIRDMIFKNLYNAGISINTTAFDLLDIDGVTFDTSRDLTADAGNYAMINRGGNGTMGNLIRISRSLFRGVSGGIDAHDVKHLVVTGGTRFEGVDINCIKVTSYNGAAAEDMRLTVDESVTFDGTAINGASANRHLSATGGGRTAPGTMYMGFLQVFTSIRWHGKINNAPNYGASFLGGTQTNAIINFDNSEWDTAPIAIQGWQGVVSMQNAKLTSANIVPNATDNLAALTFRKNKMSDSYIGITKKYALVGSSYANRLDVQDNLIDYSIGNLAPIRYVNAGTDSGTPMIFIERNSISITGGGNTLAIDGGTSGTKAFLAGNVITAAAGTAVENGNHITNYERFPAGTGGYNLGFLPTLDGTTTLVNTTCTGNITYYISDSSWPQAEVGTSFNVIRTHATNNIVISGVVGGATINGANSASFTAQYASATFTKTAANTWVCGPYSGTITFP